MIVYSTFRSFPRIAGPYAVKLLPWMPASAGMSGLWRAQSANFSLIPAKAGIQESGS